jgi:hypothetical protein
MPFIEHLEVAPWAFVLFDLVDRIHLISHVDLLGFEVERPYTRRRVGASSEAEAKLYGRMPRWSISDFIFSDLEPEDKFLR